MRRIRIISKSRRVPPGPVAGVLMLMIATTIANAQTTPLNARLALRPVTAGDISRNKLPSTIETSPGLINVGIGQAAYLEADINIAVPASDVTGVTWALTSQPSGSKAAILDSPLPAGFPVFEPSDRLVYQSAGRALLRPDLPGVYVAKVTVATKSSGTATVSQTIIGSTYAGISSCAKCHSGGLAAAMVPAWSQTGHANLFKNNISGVGETTYPQTCYACHTVGYDLNATVDNGGFSKTMAKLNWTAPGTLSPDNWTNLPADLKNVANIQCENCHGPGATHANSGGTSFEISVPQNTGACQTCHDAPTHHIKGTEWINSLHAVTTTDPSGAGREGCVGCHTSNGFIGRIQGATTVDTTYGAIACATCHEPHGKTIPDTGTHLVRAATAVKLVNGVTVKNAGNGALCMNCHQARRDAKAYVASTAGNSHYGPHDGPQADMIAGTNGYDYGKVIPSSAHQYVTGDTCVTCHMQATATTDAAFLNAGGHTFKMSFNPGGGKPTIEMVAACQNCHGPQVTQFDFPLMDYNNDGQIEGVQTEVQHLMDQLSSMLPPDNKPKAALAIDNTWTPTQLAAAYNWLFVNADGSRGVHNTAYTVGLLKAAIADLQAKGGK